MIYRELATRYDTERVTIIPKKHRPRRDVAEARAAAVFFASVLLVAVWFCAFSVAFRIIMVPR